MWISLLTAGKHGGGCSIEGEWLRAEGEFLFLFGLCRERLENRVLETALVSCRSAHENHEGGEYDIMIHDATQLLDFILDGYFRVLCESRGLAST